MSDLKKAWVKTAKSLVLAANDLGNALVDSVKVGRDKVVAWAQTEDSPVEVEATEIPTQDSADESPAEND
ncbi:MAG: hypothetical protein IJH07_00220 [Ruminococcus sp.]|nr:hypothetical protein [Ruminococcus sp.]